MARRRSAQVTRALAIMMLAATTSRMALAGTQWPTVELQVGVQAHLDPANVRLAQETATRWRTQRSTRSRRWVGPNA
jgi:hypothetical protein